MAATICRIADSSLIFLSRRRGTCPVSGQPVKGHSGEFCCAVRSRARTIAVATYRRGTLCGVRHRDGRARTAKTRRADLLASSQHLLNEAGWAALAAPPCSRHLIWETTVRSLSQNLLSFCSPTARSDGVEGSGRGARAVFFQCQPAGGRLTSGAGSMGLLRLRRDLSVSVLRDPHQAQPR